MVSDKEKLEYQKPEITIIEFEIEDIIVTSSEDPGNDDFDFDM